MAIAFEVFRFWVRGWLKGLKITSWVSLIVFGCISFWVIMGHILSRV